MLVNSTGLGKTTLTAHVADFEQVELEGKKYFQMVVESTNPVRWHITIKMTGSDIRQVMGCCFRHVFLIPKLMWHIAFK